MRQVICLFVYIGKIPGLRRFLDSNLHTRLAIVTAKELGLAFSPRNLPKKFRPDPSTFYLVIVVTDKQTDRQTYAGDSIIPREHRRKLIKISRGGSKREDHRRQKRSVVGGHHGECGARAYNGSLGQSPQRGPGAEPLIRGSGG